MLRQQHVKYTLLIGICIGISQSALAENNYAFSLGQRVALVIGNSAYQHPDTLPKLSNPTNDAEDISQALRRFGFTVIVGKDWNKEQMETAVTEFAIQARGAAAALFYYSGHGIQIKNQNYLMPIEASVKSEVQTQYQGVQLNYVLDEMDNANSAVKIAILDACRSNSFTGKFRASAQHGLAREVAASKNTVIVYATEPGNVASDGEGQNGAFTAGLLKALQGQDLSLDGVLTQTSAEVEQATHGQQTPFVDGPKLLQKRFVFAPSATVPVVSRQLSSVALAGAANFPKNVRLQTEFTGKNKCLDIVNDGANNKLQMADCGNFTGQFWIITGEQGTYRLQTQFTGENKCLDIVNDGDNNKLQMANCGNFTGQFWIITREQGTYRLQTQFTGENKCLDIVNDGANNKLQMADCGNFTGQQWKIFTR